jgi:CheY-like chemotaxis protein
MLTRLGVTCQVATNGEEAVTVASTRQFATILMDCQMPVLDGYEATHRIRNGNGPNVRTRIVALTAAVLPGMYSPLLHRLNWQN